MIGYTWCVMPQSSRKKKQDDSVEALAYEQALDRLQSIIDRIESGESTLEESLERYSEGVKLIGRCREVLDRAEQRIRELTVNDKGDLEEAEG